MPSEECIALRFELSIDVKCEQIVEGHVMAISSKDKVESVVEHRGVSVSGRGSLSTLSGHVSGCLTEVQSKDVASAQALTAVSLALLHLVGVVIEVGVIIFDDEGVLHRHTRGGFKHSWLLLFLLFLDHLLLSG